MKGETEPAAIGEGHRARCFWLIGLGAIGAVASVVSVFAAPVEGADGFGCFVKILDCGKALGSGWAKLLGIPLGVFGLFYFVSWTLLLAAYRRTGSECYRFAVTLFFAVGVPVSLLLLTVLLVVLKGVCLYCLITHAGNLAAAILFWPVRRYCLPEGMPAGVARHGCFILAFAAVSAACLFFAGEVREWKAKAKAAEEAIW